MNTKGAKYSDQIRRRYRHSKKGKWRKIVAVSLLLLFVLLIIHNVIHILKSTGMMVRYKDLLYYPEYSFNSKVRKSAQTAHKNQWVGFANFPHVPCRKAVLKNKVSNDWFPNAAVEEITDRDFVTGTNSCSEFRRKYGYERYPEASQEELDFPLAFVILFHKQFHQVHMLLRAIYKPHNVYCLTPDANSKPDLLAAAEHAASCLQNVFIASRLEKIVYGGFSRLMADINCMQDLAKHPVNWKYVINLPGQQFPLRTNLEMVRIFGRYNGANDILGMTGWRVQAERYRKKSILGVNPITGLMGMYHINVSNPRPPLGLRVVKGSAYNTMSREFIQFVLTSKKVNMLLVWLKNVFSPDEYFWAMINHNNVFDAPGRFRGVPSSKPHMTLFSIWRFDSGCANFYVRNICILTPADFPLLRRRHEMFANKFYLNYYPSALHCLDQMIFNRTLSGQADFDNIEFYKNIKFALPSDDSVESKDEYFQLYNM